MAAAAITPLPSLATRRGRPYFSSLHSRGRFPCLQALSNHCSSPLKIPSWNKKAPIRLFSSNALSPVTSPQPSSTAWAMKTEVAKATLALIRRLLLGALVWMALTFVSYLACGASLATAKAASDSIRASGLGFKVATALRMSGWADEAIVFTLATLPILELRGAIPVGYWMQLDPLHLTILSVLGNMVPVPFIVLYLKKFASFLSQKSASATQFLDLLFKRAKEKAGPVEEFQWLGLMLFVAVPFPGTGAWTGAFIAAILDMPFWSAVSANFFGVVLAGLLVNLLVNLGLKYAIITGLLLFFVSTVMWSVLRLFKKSLNSE
ncbi:uncharacterized protein LOC103722258 [Phoenix dactylifera]|uniref:Uncharacterized protein LOC103722258 n=1 Tax=Phoenix dactylifera TaxID=42345 RepID=A0A8B7D1R2_PHODC|nr:uncharacterized protein LOC103722258 [Phoenix dactylifera]